MRIYTRTGDQGETGLFGGQRVLKCHPRVAAYGEVDELNAVLGQAAANCGDAELRTLIERLQSDLFVVGADLATPQDDRETGAARKIPRVNEGMIADLEQLIDQYEAGVPALTRFILPGGSACAASLHVARAVCRRSERAVTAAMGKEALNPDAAVYLNRLSDLLFTLARYSNHRDGCEETTWNPPGR